MSITFEIYKETILKFLKKKIREEENGRKRKFSYQAIGKRETIASIEVSRKKRATIFFSTRRTMFSMLTKINKQKMPKPMF